MSTFSYGGTSYNFTGNSGVFLCSTTAVGGSGTQSNPCLLVYRATKKVKYYRDATVWLPLGRDKPATEVGQYNFRTLDLSVAWPGAGKDYDGTTAVSGSTIEGRITDIITALQSGNFVEYQDSRGRHMYGSFSADPEISDEGVLWRSMTATFVEVGTG